MHISAIITGPLANPANVYKMLTGQAQPGVAVLPNKAPLQTGQSGRGSCQSIAIQNDPTTAAGVYLYEGDANVAGDGSCQGNSIAVGVTFSKITSTLNAVSLINQFLNASGVAKVNIDVNFI